MTQEFDEETQPTGPEGAGDEPEQLDDEQLLELDDDGPDVTELDDDPAYNPDEPGLKDLKGG